MEIKVVKEYVATIYEIDELEIHSILEDYQSPYVILLKGGRNVLVPFEYLTKVSFVTKNGKRKYFDMSLNNAELFDTFEEANKVARKFKNIDETGNERFYIVGYKEAQIVQMIIDERFDGYNLIRD
ncbi:hypothetical protein [Maribacter sp. 1_MG-2023]|uniref:hypothetical protein n=1 Tax=Maribacter sp. 1_MG-2023 TaxID=3062677 RepID=UPI0026E23B41|nr:hypothetical protein [Maribacter sp. 1_MG-2023]MDO6470244.1 hypothetical protein [Maribacter sp. 1_MG-2023]